MSSPINSIKIVGHFLFGPLHEFDPVPIRILNNWNTHPWSEFHDRHDDLITSVPAGLDDLIQVINCNRPISISRGAADSSRWRLGGRLLAVEHDFNDAAAAFQPMQNASVGQGQFALDLQPERIPVKGQHFICVFGNNAKVDGVFHYISFIRNRSHSLELQRHGTVKYSQLLF